VRKFTTCFITFLFCLSALSQLNAQEAVGHLMCNPALFQQSRPILPAKKTTAVEPLTLPFFEDFTNYGPFADGGKWTDFHVYVNNTMGHNPISRGVATFDALDWRGIPYDSFNNVSFRYADSLTSQPINLSLNLVTPADSLYLSFFYQPQGKGFFPLLQDSLMLFLKTRFGGFKKVWSVAGTALKPFQQVMIPISDSLYFDSFFQFRFINIGALYWADAIWNVDYIRLNSGRSMGDTVINDFGFADNPSFLLNDYTSMPYRQFFAYPAAERASQYYLSLRNNYGFSQTTKQGYTATSLNTGTLLKPHAWNSLSVPALNTSQISTPSYSTLVPLSSVGNYARVVFQNKHYIESVSTSDPPENDTIVKDMVFDNYLAYDDGTAEKSYYLNLYPTLPGRVAVEYHLNKPDTVRGMSIYFGRQVPFATNKIFNINIYTSLAGVNGSPSDNLIYTQEYCIPGYIDTINHFWNYKFDVPVVLPAGTFYAGTFQPAESGSDSLYLGLDVNRIGSNHAYFNVLSGWEPSLVSGAIMMRPLLGQDFTASSVQDISLSARRWSVTPNPASEVLSLNYDGTDGERYTIVDLQGRQMLQGSVPADKSVNISGLAPGMYFIRLSGSINNFATLKFIKF
jgi:hypothetical protein